MNKKIDHVAFYTKTIFPIIAQKPNKIPFAYNNTFNLFNINNNIPINTNNNTYKSLKYQMVSSYINRNNYNVFDNPQTFYYNVLSLPTVYLDRVQIKCDVSLLDIDYSFFQYKSNNGFFHYNLVRFLHQENVIVKIRHIGKGKFLYIDLTLIPLFIESKFAFISAINYLVSFGVIKNNDPDLFSLFTINEIELRTDISYDIGGKKLLSTLGKYNDGEKLTSVNISSWDNRHTTGRFIKCYNRSGFVRIETIFYNKTIKELKFPVTSLNFPDDIINILKPLSLILINKISKKKPEIRQCVPFLEIAKTMNQRCLELGVDQQDAEKLIAVGQKENLF